MAETAGATILSGDPATYVGGVTQDTRRLQPGDLFVAIPGLQRDGLEFVAQAIAGGAAAIAAEHFPADRPAGLPLILVPHARRALAELSAAFFGHPSKTLAVVGVTGTDGKTSTTHLLSAILEARGLRTGWLTTVNTKIGADLRANVADHTTPEAPVVQRTLAEMLAAQVDVAIVETSSHALELERVRGTRFRVGVFTNLSPEHINFHGTFEAYRAAKARLFEWLPPDGLAVLNADDPNSLTMHAVTSARVLTYGIDRAANFTATRVRLSPTGTTFTLEPGAHAIHSRLIGRFNVANWLAAFVAATYFGATPDDLTHAAATQAPVPGRMNLVEHGQPYSVVVDFAHTPQALEKALDTVRELTAGRLLLAFGLAGGRDFANRPVMGALAARRADFFAITQDDPGDEDTAAIAAQIADGARSAGAREGSAFTIELDRRAAIRLLFERARPGDAVLLAGKGHEQRMVVGAERRPWNDARAAAEVLAELGFGVQAVP
ncbi:MAG TPA: UDP-N-acetylmuramoyl-L-alanyl-D-glutamate--2,6-diaminopimelate ligase [Chloroflexota bacterium]|nr:UDP-N-acetylmuramoyl-L-alanyl-D-glutamate--2,6-diaminopimelate ligase [Chloroflexota bacterium]